MQVSKLIVISLLSVGVCSAFAQAPGQGPGAGLSAEEKEKRCQANPEKCAQIKESVEKRREELKKRCDANPKACEEKKAQIKERLEEHREGMKERHEKMQDHMQHAPRPPAR